MRRAQRVSAERVQIGRGTDNEVRLTDIHVGLRAAVLVPRDDALAIESLDNAPIEVNGARVDNATLKLGDEIRIGPYRIEVLAPPEGCDGAIQIEMVQAVGAELERLNATTRIGLERTGASKRRYAWSGFLVIAVESFWEFSDEIKSHRLAAVSQDFSVASRTSSNRGRQRK